MKDEKIFDVFGIGNPLIDFVVKISENEFMEFNLKKGACHIMEEEELEEFFEKIKKYGIIKNMGDATANTLNTIAQLGGNVVYAGKVGKDEHGLYYEKELMKAGVKTNIKKHHKRTGRVIALVTEDAERTFVVNLGAACFLEKEDLFEEDIKRSKILYITAYQLENERLKETCLHAIDIAKKNNVKIAIDLADVNVIKKIKEEIKEIIKDVDIIFANEEEAKVFTNSEGKAMFDYFPKSIELVCIKRGSKGSWIRYRDEVKEIKPFKVKAIDSTGAGDNYAAGILYGLTHGMTVEGAAELASYLGAKVTEKYGGRLEKEDLKGMANFLLK